MSKVLFFSNNGESLPIVYRLYKEDIDVQIYVHNPKSRFKNYRGILPRLDIKGLMKALKEVDIVIFDLTHPNEGTDWDLELLARFGIKAWKKGDGSWRPNAVFGPVADVIAKSHKVIGCCTWSEDIELDRAKGAELARKIGLHLPQSYEFNNLDEGLDFLESKEGMSKLWVLKPFNNEDLDLTYVSKYEGELSQKFKYELPKRVKSEKFHHMLQEVINGTEISSEVWFNGHELVSHNRTVEGKKFLCGNLGVQIGSQNNTVWLCSNLQGIVLKEMGKLTQYLKDANYIGPIDANCIISEDKAYFLEWSARLGYDAIYCLLSLLPEGQRSSFLLNDFKILTTKATYASSARLTIPPFPSKEKKALLDKARDVPVDHSLDAAATKNFWFEDVYRDSEGSIRCAGRDGILGVQTGIGNTVDASCESVLRQLEDLRIGSDKQYRIDLAERPKKVLAKLGKDVR